ncbi:uncharacterized protein Aud_009313 [Aspergillus udagawae]|uniref:Uncharacterized protein n=1 Tax=Aspergillus udagawae TaxID=91492 RepID=A0A8E0QXF7_9EURO|nr:uncharacterized protein Aud_009313 [Aspergillus udagawae]GIC92838.1 hypothetical protein Aud_009313 [Aspergillus udagawae]
MSHIDSQHLYSPPHGHSVSTTVRQPWSEYKTLPISVLSSSQAVKSTLPTSCASIIPTTIPPHATRRTQQSSQPSSTNQAAAQKRSHQTLHPHPPLHPSHENQENQETLQACILATLPYIARIPSTQPLNDGSWELLVRKTDLPLLRHVVQRHLPFATLSDEAYHPREPTDADVSCWGPLAARNRAGFWFWMRASRVIGERVGVVADFYQDVLDSSGWTGYDFA